MLNPQSGKSLFKAKVVHSTCEQPLSCHSRACYRMGPEHIRHSSHHLPPSPVILWIELGGKQDGFHRILDTMMQCARPPSCALTTNKRDGLASPNGEVQVWAHGYNPSGHYMVLPLPAMHMKVLPPPAMYINRGGIAQPGLIF